MMRNALIVPSSNSEISIQHNSNNSRSFRSFILSPLVVFAPANLIAVATLPFTIEVAWVFVVLNLLLVATFHTALGLPDLGSVLERQVVRRIIHSNTPDMPVQPRSVSKSTTSVTAKSVVAVKDRLGQSDADSGIDLETMTPATLKGTPSLPEEEPAPPSTVVQECNDMVAQFINLCDSPSIPWVTVVQDSDVEILQHPNHAYFYKLTASLDVPYSPAVYSVFDLLADIEARPGWDDMCAEAKVLETLDPATRIQYYKSKGVMFTQGRDAVLLSHVRAVDGGKRLLCVTTSTEHDLMPVRSDAVRMDAGIAGQMLEVESETVQGQRLKLIQLVNGDPKGNLPKMVIDFVATKALPKTIRKLKEVVVDLEPKVASDLIPVDTILPVTPSPVPPTTAQVAVPAPLPVKPVRVNRTVPQRTSTTSTVISYLSSTVRKAYSLLKFAQPVMTTTLFVALIWAVLKRKSVVRYLANELLKARVQ